MVKQHIPILVKEIVSYIPTHAKVIVDGTFGHGGHTMSFIQHYIDQSENNPLLLQCYDRDHLVMARGQATVQERFPILPENITLDYINHSYATIADHSPHGKVDFILLDLGINREHVTDNIRGFSFQGEGPLDMRFDTNTGVTAYELIQLSDISEMQRWFIEYGDFTEKRAMMFATMLQENKHNELLKTTTGFTKLLHELRISQKELAPIFQCIRIATNDEF